VPFDLTTTILRYKLDPGEPGVLRSATARDSAPAVTSQELGNLRQFTREAAERGDTVVLSKVSYNAAIVDGKLSIKAGRTEVYSIPGGRAAEARLAEDRARAGLGAAPDSPPEPSPRGETGIEHGPGVREQDAATFAERERMGGTGRADTSVQPPRAGDANPRPDGEAARIRETKRLEEKLDVLQGRLSEIRRDARASAAGAAEKAQDASGRRGEKLREALVEKELREVNRRIAMLEAEKMIESNNRLLDVAAENIMAQIATARKVGFVSLASGGLNTTA